MVFNGFCKNFVLAMEFWPKNMNFIMSLAPSSTFSVISAYYVKPKKLFLTNFEQK